MNKEQVIQRISEILDAEYPYVEKKNGYYEVEIYADYRDEMAVDTANEILQSEYPMTALCEKIEDWYLECEFQEMDEVVQKVKDELSKSDLFPNGIDDDENWIEDYVKYIVCVTYPMDHFLNQEFYTNIGVDTGDGNLDYSPNATRPGWYGQYETKLDDTASILWLARQQGYKKSELWNMLSKETTEPSERKGFLYSVRSEVANTSSGLQQLTFLVRMTLKQLIELNELIKLQDRNGRNYDARKNPYCGYIVLDKKTETGLFDTWNGGGGPFEIELEKDVRLPIRYIAYALPDGNKQSYSISEVYGMCGSAWRDTVKLIHAPKGVDKSA